MKQKILVDCDLPKDYCLNNVFTALGLPSLHMGDFYSITKEKKLIKRVLQESGFSFDDILFNHTVEFDIRQTFTTEMGLWESCFHVSVDAGDVKNIYEVATVLVQKES
jgi:hypothetical protein